MDIDKTIKKIRELKGVGFFDVYHKVTFEGWRETESGENQKVLIEIHYGGPEIDRNLRYYCKARVEGGEVVTGEPGQSIDAVLSALHWYKLDQ